MTGRYVEPREFRHREKIVAGVPQLRLPVRRQWFVLAFLPFWLAAWTVGGIMAMYEVIARFDWFLIFWLGAWAVGWLFAASALAAQLGGAEIVQVEAGDLIVTAGVGKLRRSWRYRGGTITNLSSSDPTAGMFWGNDRLQLPFFVRPRRGAVRFDYGADTIYLAGGVDEPEGKAVVAWLAPRLPAGAVIANS